MESIKEAEKTIVWIEHDAVDTEECRELLGREGFSIRAANHGVAALEVLRELTPCAVVLDLDLPRMTGQEIFKFIRTTSRLAAVPVVIYSDRTMAEWPKNVPPGLTRCLSKTGTPSPALLQTIDELIEEAAAIAGYAAAETAPDVPHGVFIEVPRGPGRIHHRRAHHACGRAVALPGVCKGARFRSCQERRGVDARAHPSTA